MRTDLSLSRAPAPRQIVVPPTVLERALALINPQMARRRTMQRFQFEVLTRGYEGATAGRRAGGWITSGTSANAEILPALSRLRERSRDLARNNSYAAKAVRVLTNSVVGTGILPEFKHQDPAVVDRAKALWSRWAETSECDVDGRNDFYGLQRLVQRTVVESGECLIRRRVLGPGLGKSVPLQFQVLEPDFLDASKDGMMFNGTNLLVQGIEFDKSGRRVAYWLHREHPGDRMAWRRGDSVRVPASEVLHVFEQERPGQARGVPRAASVIMRLRNFDEYEDAQLQKQIVAACFAAFVHDAVGATGDASPAGAKGTMVETIESGTIETLPAGKAITFSNPPQVDGYSDFASQILHAVAAGYGVPYELLTGDFSRVNFSSARMALLDFWRQVDVWIWGANVPQFSDPAAKEFLRFATEFSGLPAMPRIEWRAPRREMVSPKEEIAAVRDAVRNGLISQPQAIQEVSQRDPDEVLKEIQDWNKKLDAAGITLDSDPRKVTLSGAAQAAVTIETNR